MPTRLTEAHRLAQLRVGAVTVSHLRAVFRLLDPHDLDGSFADWLSAVVALIQAQRVTSSIVAANYLSAVRTLELGEDFPAALATPAPTKVLATSMLTTGPISIKSNIGRGMDLTEALKIAEARTAAAGMRHALNGGRETITNTIRADRRARGYQRIASGNACSFCSMLAGRGAVYGEASADFEAHDGCSCSAEPVYS